MYSYTSGKVNINFRRDTNCKKFHYMYITENTINLPINLPNIQYEISYGTYDRRILILVRKIHIDNIFPHQRISYPNFFSMIQVHILIYSIKRE